MGKCVLLCNVINENAMKKAIISLFAFLLYIGIGDAVAQGTFLLRGKATNLPADKRQFELAVTHPYKNESHIVRVCPDGTFEQTISLTGKLQDVYLYLGDAVTVFTFPGDTINLEFDYKNLPESVRVWGNTPERSRELELCMEGYKQFRKRSMSIRQEGYFLEVGKCDSDTLLRRVVDYVKDRQQLIARFKQEGPLPHEEYFYQSAYFGGLFPLVSDYIVLEKASDMVQLYPEGKNIVRPYRDANFDFFGNPSALDFMQAYIRKAVDKTCNAFNQNWKNMDELAYQTVDLIVPNRKLRDWYQVSSKFSYVLFQSMEDAKKVGERLMATLTDEQAKAFLQQQMEDYIYPFQPGAEARDMTLPDFDGHEVSLSSLRGKYVYMDIWAEGCGPCMMEFQKVEALHKKYEAYGGRIAYVFVCARGDKDACRKLIKKYNVQDKGIHLFADEAHQDEVRKYDKECWPTYVLISPDGKIVEYDTARPSMLLHDGENILDRCLKK